MSKVIKLNKGLDIKLLGEAQKKLTKLPLHSVYALTPDDFKGVTPKLLVKEGDVVKAGTPLFFDKYRPSMLVVSPVSGTVSAVVRGAKRKLMNVQVTPDAEQVYESFEVPELATATRESLCELLLKSGLWTLIIQRPYGIIADPTQTPKAIFVSGFDTAPLAPDMDFALEGEMENLQAGFDVLGKLTEGKVHLGLKAGATSPLSGLKGVETTLFGGAHPAGNVGVQIHHVAPIAKGDLVWTLRIEDVAIIGRLMLQGKTDFTKVVALTGSELSDTHYITTMVGAPMAELIRKTNIRPQESDTTVRVIAGNVLTGVNVGAEGFLSYYTNQITVIPEGDKYEFMGWGMPRFHRFSVSKSYFSWLTPNKEYTLDTNLNGGHRAFVVTGLYDKYLPMDIYPMYLLKAILAKDIDKMENLGIYEVLEEDFALCEFVDPSKTDMQAIIREGIDLMIKELN